MPPTGPHAPRQSGEITRTPSASSTPTPGVAAHELDELDELDELTDAFLTSARALVGLAVRSINAAPLEVTVMQHRVLVLLASQGEQSVTELADQLGVNASNASRVCDRLERLALVSRRRSTTDARSVKVALTTDGMELLHAVNRYRRNEIRRILGSLPTDLGVRAVEALRTFNQAAHERSDADWAAPDDATHPADQRGMPPPPEQDARRTQRLPPRHTPLSRESR